MCLPAHKSVEVLFVSLMPSETEERNRTPLFGKGAQMLERMIRGVLDISMDDVHLSYIIKCRPKQSSILSHEHIQKCLPYIYKEIILVKPKVIVVFDKKSHEILAQNRHTLQKCLEDDKIEIVQTHHPLELIKNPMLKDQSFRDLKHISQLIKE